MKGKNLSKVLAFLLAAVMIFSALPLMAFASDETEPYVVSYGSPAIPMDEMTVVNLADISVEMEKGTVVSGADITWAATEQAGIEFNADAKTVTAFSKGIYKLTATAGDLTKTIYVMVKTADETEFALVDYDFTKEAFNPAEWQLLVVEGGANQGTVVPLDGSATADFVDSNTGTANGYIKLAGNKGYALINTSEIFKDFSDYTVLLTAQQMSSRTTEYTGVGSGARISLAADGTFDPNKSSILCFVMATSTVRIKSHRANWWAGGVTTNAESQIVNTDKDNFLWNNNNYHTVASVYDGENITYTFDPGTENGREVFALSKANSDIKTNWAKAENYAMDAGYPAVFTWKATPQITAFSVILNSNTLAPATEYVDTSYAVTAASPAIPMNENAKVNLADLTFEIDGEKVKGAAVELTLDNKTSEVVVENNAINAYTKGVYPATVKYGDATTKVYVVVKTVDETEWVLYDKTFEKEVLPEDWTVQTYLNGVYSDKITTVYPDVANPNPGFTPVRVHETNNNYVWSTHGFFTLNNDVVSSFADYTIDVNAVFFGHIHGTGYIYGRTNTTNGLLTLDSELQGFEIDNRNDYGIPYYTVFHNTSKKRTKIYEGTDWTVSKTVANQQYQATQDNFVVKFAGDTLSVYEADDKTEAHTFTATGITQKPGTVGIAAFTLGQGGDAKSAGGWTKIEDIKITLNNTADDMPVSEAADPKPEEPKPTINITGEGTAEVEAVVGSDNTYTVALAPAVGYKVKTLSLIVNGDMRVNLNHDSTGLVYTFTSEDLNATTISVEYITDDGTFNTVMAGASVWEERSAIRFGARTDLIKRSTTNTEVGTLDNRIKVGDTVYEITEIGMLLIPKGLFEGELTVDTKNVARQQVTKVVTLTDTFSDIAINLVGIPTSYYDVEISSRMYVAYEVNGETKYVYTDVIVRTYNQVLEAIGK